MAEPGGFDGAAVGRENAVVGLVAEIDRRKHRVGKVGLSAVPVVMSANERVPVPLGGFPVVDDFCDRGEQTVAVLGGQVGGDLDSDPPPSIPS